MINLDNQPGICYHKTTGHPGKLTQECGGVPRNER